MRLYLHPRSDDEPGSCPFVPPCWTWPSVTLGLFFVQGGAAAGEEGGVGRGCQRDGAVIGGPRVGDATRAGEVFGGSGMVGLVVGQGPRQRGQMVERQIKRTGFGQGDGAIQADDRRRLMREKGCVKCRDLRPVGRRLAVEGGDGGFQLERARAAAGGGGVEKRQPLVQHGAVPEAAVLLGQRHGFVLPQTGRAAGVGQEEKRQRAFDFGLVRGEGHQKAGEKDRLGTEIGTLDRALGIAGGEDQIDHGEDRVQPVGQVLGAGDGEGDARGGVLGPGAAEALAHGRLGIEEDSGDLRRGEAAQGAQRQGDPRLLLKRRVAAGEDQAQAVVRDGLGVGLGGLFPGEDGDGVAVARKRGLAAIAVDGLAQGGAQEPAGGAGRHPCPAPVHEGRGGGLLQRVLGALEIARAGDEGGQKPPPIGAQRLLQRRLDHQ
jgi:hypothetical protein